MNDGTPDQTTSAAAAGPYYSLADLETLTHLPARTIRYYIQRGLLPGPQGTARAPIYGLEHLSALVEARRLTGEGLRLDAVIDRLRARRGLPRSGPEVGAMWTSVHVAIGRGLTLIIDQRELQLSEGELRRVALAVTQAVQACAAPPTEEER